ncbi:MAG: zinc ABC transporter substrate-binding protein [Deltaproteobacteria bacterium]|nr:zinc ABC transporter substrate-binding protein [Deltaproteobacteria bacterium]
MIGKFSRCLVLVLPFFACAFLFLPAPSFGQPRLKLMASIFPLYEFAREIGGDQIQAEMLLPPGMEPHTWEPKPSEVARISQMDLFLFIGRGMEPWAAQVLRAAQGRRLRVVEVGRELASSGITLPAPSERGSKEVFDPHLWLDFALDQKVAEIIALALGEGNPENAARYQARARALRGRLEELDRKYQTALAACRHRQIIHGGHPAFAYLARRYGLSQVALYGLNPNAEPTPRRLAEVLQVVKRQGVRYIFFEELVSPKLARVLAREAGIGTLVLNPGANLTVEQRRRQVTFWQLMEANLENLRRGLECG